MAEPTATGLVHNLDTDPNCLKQRESWRSNVTKTDDGHYRYALKDGQSNFSLRPSMTMIPEGGIAVVQYRGNNARAESDYPSDCTILSDNGWLLVVKALKNSICAIRYYSGYVELDHVTVLPDETEYRRMRDGYKLPAGFDGDTMPLMGGGRAKRHRLAARLRRSDWVVAA
ncbi:hypothetical protein [Bifidobacterium longum]|uniref:hypothetical protein n=1 Tax=Bifidobacterium longum TaxID=216816 RepID=UPI00103E89EF|nr:hypothetical protein [Bifidobacterium longum]TCF21573.1 hypothetical protein MCC10091_1280 [Bifidobacterium longum subsp. longum]